MIFSGQITKSRINIEIIQIYNRCEGTKKNQISTPHSFKKEKKIFNAMLSDCGKIGDFLFISMCLFVGDVEWFRFFFYFLYINNVNSLHVQCLSRKKRLECVMFEMLNNMLLLLPPIIYNQICSATAQYIIPCKKLKKKSYFAGEIFTFGIFIYSIVLFRFLFAELRYWKQEEKKWEKFDLYDGLLKWCDMFGKDCFMLILFSVCMYEAHEPVNVRCMFSVLNVFVKLLKHTQNLYLIN